MVVLLLLTFSPVILLFCAAACMLHAYLTKRELAFWFLASRSALYAIVAFGLSFAHLLYWMETYPARTGYSAGNGPAGWIFFVAPPAIALGQAIALVEWWLRKIRAQPAR